MILKDALRSLGIGSMGDPDPGPGVASGLSYSSGYGGGAIPLVGSFGIERAASYRAIYLMNPWVYAAVNYIARGIGQLPLHVYELDARARKTRLRSDVPQTAGRPIGGVQLDRILRQPAGRISRSSFYTATLKDKLIYGPALWEIVGPAMPTGLRRIPWDNVTRVEEDGEGGILYYEIGKRSRGLFGGVTERRRLLANDVIHFGLGSDNCNVAGVSPLESCKHTLALHEAIMRHLNAYFENSARGSGYVQVEDEEQAKEAREVITSLYTSPESAGKPIIMSGKWQSFSDDVEHAGIVELVRESRLEIAATYQTPPPILGLLEHAIRANVKEMREQYVRETRGPHATEMEDDIEAQLLPRVPSWSNLFVEFQLAQALRPDLEARALVYQRLMWVMAIDEIRELENMPPLDIAGVTDVPWAAGGAVPVTTAATQRADRTAAVPPSDQDAGGRAEVTLEQAIEVIRMTAEIDRIRGNGHLNPEEVHA